MDKGLKAVRFIECLQHTTGEWSGKPLILEPWQREFTQKLFGTLNSDGNRQYREAFLEIPRKNGKSTYAAAIVIEELICGNEPGGQIYSCANDRKQAKVVFNEVARMLRKEKELLAKCKIIDSMNRIVFYETSTTYDAVSADAKTKDGYNPSLVIYDELHEAPSRDLYDVMKSGMGGRRQPLFITITTAGFDKHSICYELYDYGCKVRDGLVNDPTFLPLIFEASPEDDWEDENVWRKANPNIGISPKWDFLRAEAAKAKELPTALNNFKRKYLNLWTDADVCWIPPDKWEACSGSINEAELIGRPCYLGLDLASTTDTAAVILLFPLDDGRYAVLSRFYVPRVSALKRERRDRVPYSTWIAQGHIIATEGEVIDYDVIRKDINELNTKYAIQEIALDRWNATQLSTQLTGDGFTVIPFGQGYQSMAAPSKEFELLVVSKRLLHGGNPVLAWQASNVVAEQDAAGNVKPNKARSTEKIDGIVALVMALGRALEKPLEAASVYETRGLRSF